MSQVRDELIELMTRVLTLRTSKTVNMPGLQSAAADFVRALRSELERSGAASWACVVGADTSARLEARRTPASIGGSEVEAFALRLRGGGFQFEGRTSERDVLNWADLASETHTALATFAEGSERLRRKTASIHLSPPPNAPGWLGAYDSELDSDLNGPPGGLLGRSHGAGADGAGDGSQARPTAGESWEVRDEARSDDAEHGATADAATAARERATAQTLRRMRATVEVAHERAEQGRSIDLAEARSTAEDLVRTSLESAHDALREIQYANHDSYTLGHSVRVALLAVLVGRRLGLSERVLIELGTAGLLHDVGKARIAREILFKPDRLDDDERREMSRHPALGAEILVEQRDAGPLSVGAAFGHHLRHDGAGYPAVPSWFRHSSATAIVQVCDVFEALTAVRPYKPALSPRRAFEVMLSDAAAFHPAALGALVRSMGVYPPGTHVRLSDGARGVVLRAGADLARPMLRLTHDGSGRELCPEEQGQLDLSHAATALEILGAVRAAPEHHHEPGVEADCCR